jgi:hypothetical protein
MTATLRLLAEASTMAFRAGALVSLKFTIHQLPFSS